MTLAQIPQICGLLAVLFQGVWAFRVWRLGLVRRYPVLFYFLLSTLAISVITFVLIQFNVQPFGPSKPLYSWLWVIFQPLIWTLSFCIVVEVYNRVLEGFKGLQRLGQLAMYGALGAVGCLFLAMMVLDTPPETWNRFWAMQERGVYFGLTLLCVLLLAFVWFFKLKLSGNVRVVFGVFGLIFASQAGFVTLFLEHGKDFEQARVLVVSAVAAGSMMVATLLFSAKGEPSAAKPYLSADTEHAMTSGLQGFNDILVKVLRS